jgi:hypothetical protein
VRNKQDDPSESTPNSYALNTAPSGTRPVVRRSAYPCFGFVDSPGRAQYIRGRDSASIARIECDINHGRDGKNVPAVQKAT